MQRTAWQKSALDLGPDISRAEFVPAIFHVWAAVVEQKFRAFMDPAAPSQISREAGTDFIVSWYLSLLCPMRSTETTNLISSLKHSLSITSAFICREVKNAQNWSLSRHIHQTILNICSLDTLSRKSSGRAAEWWGFVQKFWNLLRGL